MACDIDRQRIWRGRRFETWRPIWADNVRQWTESHKTDRHPHDTRFRFALPATSVLPPPADTREANNGHLAASNRQLTTGN